MHFWVWEILRNMGGPRVRRRPMKWSANAESARNTALNHVFSTCGPPVSFVRPKYTFTNTVSPYTMKNTSYLILEDKYC
jgi:hypothetical protein